jgi:ribose transport system substrate-binding protein
VPDRASVLIGLGLTAAGLLLAPPLLRLRAGFDRLLLNPTRSARLAQRVQRLTGTRPTPPTRIPPSVTTDCLVSYVHPIGGYALGAASAEFIALKAGRGGKVLALRTLAGVNELETRWAAAKVILDREGVDIVGMEFNNADPAKAKAIVSAYLKRFGTLDGVWLDAGFASVAVTEAFKNAGKPIPPLTGDDEQGFLQLWQKDELTAIAPTYPVYEWRTAVIAATYILSGKPVPKEWILPLPQPVITSDTLDDYLIPGVPPQFFSTCGCRNMPGFPQDWGGK